ncbi:MAG: hypothetical protein ACI8R9_001417, partial [Paraglaciecola sp.]
MSFYYSFYYSFYIDLFAIGRYIPVSLGAAALLTALTLPYRQPRCANR